MQYSIKVSRYHHRGCIYQCMIFTVSFSSSLPFSSVSVVRTMIFGHQVPVHTDLEREAQRAFQDLYPVARRNQFIQDSDDQV